jgi:hypothetical protein
MGFTMFVLVEGVASMRRMWVGMVLNGGFQIGLWECVQVTLIFEG